MATFGRRKKRLENWSDRDTLILIDVWRENHMALQCVKRNHHIYQKIAQQLLKRSVISRSTFEVKNKICNLTSLYRREKLRVERESDVPNWKYWNAVHDVMCAVGTPFLDPSMADGSSSIDDSAAAVADSRTIFHPQVEAILSTPTKNEMESRSRVAGPESTFAIDALFAVNEIKQEVSMHEGLNENHGEGCWESNVGRLAGDVEERQQQQPPPSPSMRKRKYRLEDQRLRIVRLIYEEARRMNSATRRADAEAIALMREQLDLQRRSLEVEERIAGAIERACQDLSVSVRNMSSSQLPVSRRTVAVGCNGNPSPSSSSVVVNGTAQSSSAYTMDDL